MAITSERRQEVLAINIDEIWHSDQSHYWSFFYSFHARSSIDPLPKLKHFYFLALMILNNNKVNRLGNSIQKFYGRCPDLIAKYQRPVRDMLNDSFPL